MGVFQDLRTEDVKEPSFDRPDGADPADLAIAGGTRVVLSYHGQRLSAQVTGIERLGSLFVGRVMKFASDDARPIDLAPGDAIRFRLRDVLETE